MMLEAAYVRFQSTGQLPSPTGVALQVLRLSQDESVDLGQLASVIESDPAIASRILKLVNSPLVGMSRQVASVERAVAMLGIRTVTGLALGFSLVNDHRSGRCRGFDYDQFWSESVGRAAAARQAAVRVKLIAPDEAFTFALLAKLGRLAFASAAPNEYASVLHMLEGDSPGELLELEQATFEIDHNQLTAMLMAEWHLPEVFREAVLHQDDPDGGGLDSGGRVQVLARLLQFSGLVARVLTRPTVFRDDLSALVVRANRLGIAPDVYHDVFDATSEEWRNASAIYSVDARRVPPLAEIYSHAHQRQTEIQKKDGVSPSDATGTSRDPRS